MNGSLFLMIYIKLILIWMRYKLVQALGIRRETIVNLENGKYNPSLKLAMDIAHYFGKTVEEIFTFED